MTSTRVLRAGVYVVRAGIKPFDETKGFRFGIFFPNYAITEKLYARFNRKNARGNRRQPILPCARNRRSRRRYVFILSTLR